MELARVELQCKRKLNKGAAAYLFDGLEEAFEKDWTANTERDLARKRRQWNHLVQWANLFARRNLSLIPQPRHRPCLIETLQQYKRFSGQEICTTLRVMGRMAESLYCARRDFFGDGAMNEYYVRCMEVLIWMVATLDQRDRYPGFTDLVTVLGQHLRKAAKESPPTPPGPPAGPATAETSPPTDETLSG